MALSVARPRGQYKHVWYVWLVAAALAALMLGTAVAAPPDPQSPAVPTKIDPALRGKLAQRGMVEAIVTLRADPTPGSPSELAAFAEATQAELVDRIRAAGDEVVTAFWLKNMLLVRAKPTTLHGLTALESVERVLPNFELSRPDPQAAKGVRAAAEVTWGLSRSAPTGCRTSGDSPATGFASRSSTPASTSHTPTWPASS